MSEVLKINNFLESNDGGKLTQVCYICSNNMNLITAHVKTDENT